MKSVKNYDICDQPEFSQFIQNFSTLIVVVFPAIGMFKNLSIQRKLSTKNVIVSEIPKTIKRKEKSTLYDPTLLEEFEDEYRDSLKNFYGVISESLPFVNMGAFNNNLHTLKIGKSKSLLTYFKFLNTKNIAAQYVWQKNGNSSIEFIEGEVADSIYHEFLHMSSTKNLDTFFYSGFMQEKIGEKPFSIGLGLNEGYTDLLTERYFSKYGASTDGYALPKHIASILEILIGKENMEKLYFDANLYELIEILKNYDSLENILSFLKSLDLLCNYAGKNHISFTNINTKELYRKLSKILFNWIILKILQDYSLGLKSFLDCKLEINHALRLLGKNIFFGNIKYSGCTDDELVSMQRDALEKLKNQISINKSDKCI